MTSQETTATAAPTEEQAPLTTADYNPPRAETITNAVCGAVISLLGIGALLVAMDLGLGSLSQPRAGTWPGVLSALLIVLGIGVVIRAKTFDDAEKLTSNAVAVGVGALSLPITVMLMPYAGFEIPSVLLMIFWMSVLGKERYRTSVPTSVIAVVAFYLIFITGLSVPIPRLF